MKFFRFFRSLRTPSHWRHAFTMLEVIATIVVIGVLVTIGTIRFDAAKEKTYVATMLSDLRNYASSHEAYRFEMGLDAYVWPEEMEENGFGFSENVYSDSSDAKARDYFVRVRHEKSNTVCELDYSQWDPRTENHPICYPADFRNYPPSVDFEVYAVPESPLAGNAVFGYEEEGSGILDAFAPAFSSGLSTTVAPREGAEGPGLQFPVGRTLQFVPSVHDRDEEEVLLTWEFANIATAKGSQVYQRFLNTGKYPVTLIGTDAKGVSRRTTKIVSIGLDGNVSLLAQWDPCSSYGTGVFRDVAQGNHAPLLWNGAPAAGAEWAWQEGPPPHLDLTGPFRAYAESGSLSSGNAFAVLGAMVSTGSGQQALMSAGDFEVSFVPGVSTTVAGFEFEASPQLNRWSTVGVQVRPAMGGGSEVELFIDGISRGKKFSTSEISFAGPVRMFCGADGVSCLEGRAGPLLLYRGVLGADELANRVNEIGTNLAVCQGRGENVAPFAHFSWEPVPVRGRESFFDATESYDPNEDSPLTYEWVMRPTSGESIEGNGGPLRPWTPPVNSTTPFYDVTLRVIDPSGLSTSYSRRVEVNTAPEASISFTPQVPLVGEEVSFVAQSTDPDGETLTHSWMLDTQPASGSDVSRSWAEAGSKTVRLYSLDPRGAADTASVVVPVRTNQAPVVGFDVNPAIALVGEEVTFTSTSSDADGDQIDLLWEFGNGIMGGNGAVVKHTYNASENYEATLKGSDHWTSNSLSRVVTVVAKPTLVAPSGPNTPSVRAGHTDTVKVTLTNNSAQSRTFAFSPSLVLGRDFEVENPAPMTVPGKGSAEVKIPVEAAPQLLSGTSGRIRLIATDAGKSAANDTTELDITVGLARKNPLLTSPGSQSMPVNSSRFVSISLRNATNASETFKLKVVSSNGAAVSVPATLSDITLDAFASTAVSVPLSSAQSAGSATITLTAEVAGNASFAHSISFAATSVNSAPIATLSCPASAYVGSSFTCTLSGSDPDGQILNASTGWNLSGGSWTRSIAARGTAGTQQVCAVLTDAGGASSANACDNVSVVHKYGCMDSRATNYDSSATASNNSCTYPTLNATVSCPSTGHRGVAFSCTVSASGGVAPYTYSFGADRTQSFTYNSLGTVNPSGSVTDAVGQSRSATDAVSIVNRNPTASITCPANANSGTSYTCTATASDPDGDALSASGWTKGSGNNWSRSFTARTDGGTSESRSITVVDGFGGSVSASRNVIVALQIQGCMDSSGSNYNPSANVPASCAYLQLTSHVPAQIDFYEGVCTGVTGTQVCPQTATITVSASDPAGLGVSISGACSASGSGSASCSRVIHNMSYSYGTHTYSFTITNNRTSIQRTVSACTRTVAYDDSATPHREMKAYPNSPTDVPVFSDCKS